MWFAFGEQGRNVKMISKEPRLITRPPPLLSFTSPLCSVLFFFLFLHLSNNLTLESFSSLLREACHSETLVESVDSSASLMATCVFVMISRGPARDDNT